MGSLDVWGAIAASILLLQCLVWNLILLALAFGLWRGSAWVRNKTGVGLTKADEWMQQGQRLVRQAQSQLAGPFVRLRGRVTGWRATMRRLKG